MSAFRITPINVSMDGAGVRFAPVPTTTVGGVSGVRIADMPDLGAFDSSSSIVGEKAGSGRFSATAMRSYLGDYINVKNYGAVLDGVTDDSAAFAAARTAAQAGSPNGVVFVPTGKYHVDTPPPYTSTPVQWLLAGVAKSDGFLVTSVTVGDQLENYMPQRGKYFQRTDPLGAAFPVGALHQPMLQIDYTGKGSSLGILQVNGYQNDGSGYMWGIEGQLHLNQTGTGQCVAIAGVVWRDAPSSPGWALYGQFVDNSGLPGGAVIGEEVSIFVNGPEANTTYFAPAFGSRVGLHLGLQKATHPGWTANSTIATGAVISPAGASAYVYIAQTGGTTGSTEPVWPTSAGTVSDGTVVWSYGTTAVGQISRGLHISGNGVNSPVAAPIYFTNMDVFDAIIDMSSGDLTMSAALNPNVAAIRMAHDWPIDFSGGGSGANQNRRTLKYNSTSNALEYAHLGNTLFAVQDTSGGVSIGGPHTVGYQLQVLGTNTVGISTDLGTFTTAMRMSADQRISFTGDDAHYVQYRAATQRLYYVVGGVDMWSVDASGNVRAKGTVTGSTTP